MVTILVVLDKTSEILGYEYYHVFHGYMSELLGNDNYGTKLTDYVYSNICGGRCTKDGFSFSGNPYFYIRTSCESVWSNFTKNIKNKKHIFNGFNVIGFDIIDTPLNKRYYETDASTPILLSNKYKFSNTLSLNDICDIEKYLVKNIMDKAKEKGFDADKNLSIKIVSQRRHRDINYRGVINKGRNLRVRINCDDATKEFILTNGLGRSTSCGFGFLI